MRAMGTRCRSSPGVAAATAVMAPGMRAARPRPGLRPWGFSALTDVPLEGTYVYCREISSLATAMYACAPTDATSYRIIGLPKLGASAKRTFLGTTASNTFGPKRSEEHTSELQSR